MRAKFMSITSAVALAVALAVPATADVPIEREVLGPNDGWAAAEGGTTGGAAADEAHVYTVTTWEEFREALGGSSARGDTTPRIVRVVGTIDAHTDADGQPLSCEDFADPEYSLDAYLEAYDPETWGWDDDPSGPLEEARDRSADVQVAQIRQFVGSNTTIIGVGDDAQIVHANLMIRDADNVIVRNLRISDAYDCFPQWDPGDGSAGNWNSAYDNVSIWGSSHVWIDHNTFDDGDNPPSSLPQHFGRPFEVHDGLLDITHGSDLVTVSYNVFDDHDKVMLIGSTNSPKYDPGKLRVTLHHNRWQDLGQRTPRVRYGQVHVYNNHYVQDDVDIFQYSWGVGVESSIYAENNYFDLADGIDPAEVIHEWGGTRIGEIGSLVNGHSRHHRVDLVAAYNAANDPDLSPDAGWTPTYVERVDPTQSVPARVAAHAGAGNLR